MLFPHIDEPVKCILNLYIIQVAKADSEWILPNAQDHFNHGIVTVNKWTHGWERG
jgi:hypothetical protein